MNLKDNILIVGGDTILNMIIATIFTREGHDVAIIDENQNNAFNYSNLFLAEDGGQKLSQLNIAFGQQEFSSSNELINRLVESIHTARKGRLRFFGKDYRKLHKAKIEDKLVFHLSPHQKQSPTPLEKTIYRKFPATYGGFRRFLPRPLKRISVCDPKLTILTTPPSFIGGIEISHEDGLRIQSAKYSKLHLCECAKFQIEDFKDSTLFEKSFRRYIEDIEQLKQVALEYTELMKTE